jgi:hypothetical protein
MPERKPIIGNVEIPYDFTLEVYNVSYNFEEEEEEEEEEELSLGSINQPVTAMGYCSPLLMWDKVTQLYHVNSTDFVNQCRRILVMNCNVIIGIIFLISV